MARRKQSKLLKELNKVNPFKKRIYFLQKHGLANSRTDYSKKSEQWVVDKYFNGKQVNYDRYVVWEQTDEYKYLCLLMLQEHSESDWLEIYSTVMEQAKEGDSRAIKTLLDLQKELKKKLNTYEQQGKIQEEIDDLI